jgi:hypothetical protein
MENSFEGLRLMAERNLIGEGFVSNTLAPGGAVSGTQTVSIPEINALVDGDFTTTALTITGSESILLDADLGARWKLDRIDLYTDEISSANFDMSVSEDGTDYYPITMTGSAGSWSGPVSGTTVSGAPRYIRYEHQPLVDRAVQEWLVVSDDSLVDFGPDGTQTSATIESAPIGRPSDSVTELVLFNQYNRAAQGFVLIDETGNEGDDNIEISTSPSGPWFGRKTQSSRQPDATPWHEADYFGDVAGDIYGGRTPTMFQNVRVVSGTGYETNFTSGDRKGWTTSGFDSDSVVNGSFRGDVSTSTTPSFQIDNDFGGDAVVSAANSPDSAEDIRTGFTPFRAEDYDTVTISLTTPTLVSTDLVEGPRLFWRDHTDVDYNLVRSTVSTTPGSNFNGAPQTFNFAVGPLTTWSGLIRSLKVQNYTTTTGVSITSSLNSLEVFYGDRGDRVALEFVSTISGSFPAALVDDVVSSAYRTVLNTENPIKQPCIITSVSAQVRTAPTVDYGGWFLVRWSDGFVYNDRADEVNAAVTATGTPFEVVHFVAQDESWDRSNAALFNRQPVLWHAEPGDMVGYGYRSFLGGGGGSGPVHGYDTNLTTTTGGALTNLVFLPNLKDGSTNQDVSDDLNSISSWNTTGRRINVQFKSISAGDYLANGTYTTPIFDGGGDPALLSFAFESVEENGTSIDVSGSAAFDTVNARASATPPNTSVALGRRVNQFALGAHPSDRPSSLDPPADSDYMLGFFNPEVTNRENTTGTYGDNSIENFGSNVLYHEEKDELWILNVLLSGTQGDNMRPIWDVYDLPTGSYERTQHATGTISYYHENAIPFGNEVNAFTAVGWIADYDREQIYVITRDNEFTIGAGSYNGIILDLEGEFQDVFWRNDALIQDIQTEGYEGSDNDADKYLQNMRTVVYRYPYFYSLTDADTFYSEVGIHINVFRFGVNPSEPDDENDVEFVYSVEISTVPGFGFIGSSRPVETFTYCSANDLFYFTVRDDDEIYTMQIAVVGEIPNETFTFSKGPISEDSLLQLSPTTELTDGFLPTRTSLNNWDGAGEIQDLKNLTDWTYVPAHDTFALLLNYSSLRTREFIREGEFTDVLYFLWTYHHHSMVIEVAAETQGADITTPKIPNQKDPFWGVLSGTLGYEQLQENSLLFPTGRYAQLEYKLNSDDGRTRTPYLLESQVTQGLRVGEVPASGTKTIYLRTNIPEGTSVGDQTGRLKVFWELQEN